MKTISVLLLDDMSIDFEKIQQAILQIGEKLEKGEIKFELFYNNHQDVKKIIANFVAYKRENTNLQEIFKDVVDREVERIKEKPDLISIIDIRWDINSGQHGCDFYSEYHSLFNDKNSIFITIVKKAKLPEKIRDIKSITKSKNEPYGPEFTEKLEKIIFDMPIIKDNFKNSQSINTPLPGHPTEN